MVDGKEFNGQATLLQVAPDAGDAVDVIGTVLMVAGGVVLVGALIVLLRNRRT